MMMGLPDTPVLQETGIEGLDDVLQGGLMPGDLYAITGDSGTGKTTLCMQYLLAGAAVGERGLIVALSESAADLRAMAAAHGWTLDGIEIVELGATEAALSTDADYTMFHPAEVELTATTRAILNAVERFKPRRAVIDSVGELRLLAQAPLRYRRQILALRHFFKRGGCTLMMVDDPARALTEMAIASIASGIIALERDTTSYGVFRRRIQVVKMRGRKVREGYHDMRIRRGGLEVYPRLVAAEHGQSYAREAIPSGLTGLDRLLGGGLARGTSSLLIGPAGTGKSSLAAQYARAAAARGHHAAVLLFDESIATFVERSTGLGFDVQALMDAGRLTLRQVDPTELAPGEFVQYVRSLVEEHDTRVLVVDSLTGFLNAMPNERLLVLHLHELLSYLGRRGVSTILVLAQHGLVGEATAAPVDASYLADTVVLLRFFEAEGAVRIAISVVKKRTGPHERTIRELRLEGGTITIGEPITEFAGVLTGVPVATPRAPRRRKSTA